MALIDPTTSNYSGKRIIKRLALFLSCRPRAVNMDEADLNGFIQHQEFEIFDALGYDFNSGIPFKITMILYGDKIALRPMCAEEVDLIYKWANDTISILTTPIADESPVLQTEEVKAKFQDIKAKGLNMLIDSRQISSELSSRMWEVYTSILRCSDAFSKGDTAFDFKGEIDTLIEELRDVINYISNK